MNVPARGEFMPRDGRRDGARGRLGRGEAAVGEQHAEFVAAEPRQQVGLGDKLVNHSSDAAEQFVAGGMAADVVDHLELIEIEIEQGVPASTCSCVGEQPFECGEKLTARRQAGDQVLSSETRSGAVIGRCSKDKYAP